MCVHVCVGGVHAVCVCGVWGEKPGQWFMEIESWISLKNEGIMTSLPPNHRNLSRLLPIPPNLSELNKTSTSDTFDTDLPSFQDIAQAMELMMMEVVSFVLRPQLVIFWHNYVLLQFSCCSRRYRVLQSFVTWFSQAKKIPNITRLITSQCLHLVPAESHATLFHHVHSPACV